MNPSLIKMKNLFLCKAKRMNTVLSFERSDTSSPLKMGMRAWQPYISAGEKFILKVFSKISQRKIKWKNHVTIFNDISDLPVPYLSWRWIKQSGVVATLHTVASMVFSPWLSDFLKTCKFFCAYKQWVHRSLWMLWECWQNWQMLCQSMVEVGEGI